MTWYALIGLLALTVRGLFLWDLHETPFWATLMGDAERYDAWACELAGGDWLGRDVFYQAPLYPYALGLVYWLFGHSLLAARVVQSLLGAAACVLVADAGRRFFSPRIGIVAGLLLAVYPPAVFFDALLQKTVLDGFLMCLLLAVVAAATQQPQQRRLWGAVGLVLGSLVLTRENALLLTPVLAGWLVWCSRGGPRWNRVQSALGMAVGIVVVLAPVAVRNGLVGGEWHLTTSQFGPNFYIGNNAEANGLYAPLRVGRGSPRYERIDATAIAEHAAGRTLTPREVSRYWVSRTRNDIEAQPRAWLTLLAQKWCLGWNVVETGDFEDIYTYADESPVLRGLLSAWDMTLLVALAAFGVVATRHDWRRTAVLCLMALTYAGSVALFYVFARYRYPVVPVLVLLAAAGMNRGIVLLQRRRIVELLACGVAAVVAGAFAAGWGLPPLFPQWPDLSTRLIQANTRLNLALRLEELHADPPLVLAQYELIQQIKPGHAAGLAEQGRFLWERGQRQAGIALMAAAVEADSGLSTAQLDLGRAYEAEQRLADAEICYTYALQIDPWLLPARAGLIRLYLDGHRPYDAQVLLNEGLLQQRHDPQLLQFLGVVQLSQGRSAAALASLTEAMKQTSHLTDVRVLLGMALAQEGRTAEALTQWRLALPNLPPEAGRTIRLREAIARLQQRASDAPSPSPPEN